ncbi:MAG: hypothetical protein ACRELX_03225 [Longimicrobiales bacterium]
MQVSASAGVVPRISAAELARARVLRDLTEPAGGPHALQQLIESIAAALASAWSCDVLVHRADPVVSVHDNYDALHYPSDGASREARYSRYVTADRLLRTHTSAVIPPLLRSLAGATPPVRDTLLVCPGLVYRRDAIDRLHTGEPHQCDLWRISRGRLTTTDLGEMIGIVAGALGPDVEIRTVAARHPYTTDGLQVDAHTVGEWVEICECGMALPGLLAECGLDPNAYTGLAMGLGLDRLLMLVKGIDDIRLLRATDPRIAGQMLDRARYRPVSDKPPIRRDLSIAVREDMTPEEIGDRVRSVLGADSGALESVEVLSETLHAGLPAAAIERIGMLRGQKNVLLRVVIRDLTRTLTAHEGNVLRDRVYAALHEGTNWQWATTPNGP